MELPPEEVQRLRELDRHHLWHPFTQMTDLDKYPQVIITRAEGNYLFDAEGNRYLDGVSSLWCNLFGHRVPEIDSAVREQLEKVAHSTLLGLSHPLAIRLAARLAELAPGDLGHIFFSDSGSEAVEVALKVCLQYWRQAGRDPQEKRTKYIHLGEAYHGDTLGAVSVGGIAQFHRAYRPLLFETISVPPPFCYRCPWGREPSRCRRECQQAAVEVIAARAPEAAAVVMEPLVQGAAGMIVHPEGYLAAVRAATRAADVPLLLDEVAVGFGRTGKLFACQHENVVPEALCLAKGITGGYLPLAATIFSEAIYAAFLGEYPQFRSFFHGHTYTGNPLACAAALATLSRLERPGFWAEQEKKAELLCASLVARLSGHPHVGDLRLRGLMGGIELVADRQSKARFPAAERIGHRVILAARQRGVMLRPLGDVIVLMPPLSVTSGEVEFLVAATAEAICEVLGGE